MADRETIIETGGDGGGGIGMGAVVAILVVVLLIAGGYLVFSHNGASNSVTLDVPKVTVTTPKS